WQFGDVITRREISWGRPCLAVPVRVVEDSESLLATYLPERAPMSYADYPDVVWPTESGRHPWWPNAEWRGHGVLMLQRPGEQYAVWHFWAGEERRFESWYFNIQEPFRRTPIGHDTQDLELDVVLFENGQWSFKDDDKMDGHLRSGRYTAEEIESAWQTGREIAALLDAAEHWWDESLRSWHPDPSWAVPEPIADGWASVPWITSVSRVSRR
ncbi:MAG TPA: DUF402 domain-containing protein, partial [Acidimicrobiia bacterium]